MKSYTTFSPEFNLENIITKINTSLNSKKRKSTTQLRKNLKDLTKIQLNRFKLYK